MKIALSFDSSSPTETLTAYLLLVTQLTGARQGNIRHEASDRVYSGPEELVSLYGREYTPPKALSSAYEYGVRKRCFYNAAKMTLLHPWLTYVEGFAINDFGVPMLHAWNVDSHSGDVVDSTWPWGFSGNYGCTPEKGAMVGIAFAREAVEERLKARDEEESLFDCPALGWPLLFHPFEEERVPSLFRQAARRYNDRKGLDPLINVLSGRL